MLRQFVMLACIVVSGPVFGQDKTGLGGLREQVQRDGNTDWLRRFPLSNQPDFNQIDRDIAINNRLRDIEAELRRQEWNRALRENTR